MRINLRVDQYLELEKLGLGVFEPVNNFMNKEEFFSVIKRNKTIKGEIFPLPIFLDVSNKIKDNIKINAKLNLYFKNKRVGQLKAESICYM